MNTFKDKTGAQWNIELNLGNARRVKSETGIDLINSIKFDQDGVRTDDLSKMSEDPYLLMSVLYSLCRCNAENEIIESEEFERRFDMDTVEAAVDSLMSEIIDFFPHAKRIVLKTIYERSSRFKQQEMEKLDQLVQSEGFKEALESQLNSSLTNLQE